jgi:hypothetical protein
VAPEEPDRPTWDDAGDRRGLNAAWDGGQDPPRPGIEVVIGATAVVVIVGLIVWALLT